MPPAMWRPLHVQVHASNIGRTTLLKLACTPGAACKALWGMTYGQGRAGGAQRLRRRQALRRFQWGVQGYGDVVGVAWRGLWRRCGDEPSKARQRRLQAFKYSLAAATPGPPNAGASECVL